MVCHSLWSELVFNYIFFRKSLPNFCMGMRRSKSCVNFGNVCTKSFTKRTYRPFCLFVKHFYYTVQSGKWIDWKWVTKTALRKIHHGIIIDILQFSQINLLLRHIAWVVYVIKSKTIFDYSMLFLQIPFKVVLLYCWNKGQKWWNSFYKTYGHFSFCSNSAIHNLRKQNIEYPIFYNNVYFFKTWVLCKTCK